MVASMKLAFEMAYNEKENSSQRREALLAIMSHTSNEARTVSAGNKEEILQDPESVHELLMAYGGLAPIMTLFSEISLAGLQINELMATFDSLTYLGFGACNPQLALIILLLCFMDCDHYAKHGSSGFQSVPEDTQTVLEQLIYEKGTEIFKDAELCELTLDFCVTLLGFLREQLASAARCAAWTRHLRMRVRDEVPGEVTLSVLVAELSLQLYGDVLSKNSSDPLVARSCYGMWNKLYSRCEGLGVHVFVAGERTWKGDLTSCLHSQQDHMMLHIMLETLQGLMSLSEGQIGGFFFHHQPYLQKVFSMLWAPGGPFEQQRWDLDQKCNEALEHVTNTLCTTLSEAIPPEKLRKLKWKTVSFGELCCGSACRRKSPGSVKHAQCLANLLRGLLPMKHILPPYLQRCLQKCKQRHPDLFCGMPQDFDAAPLKPRAADNATGLGLSAPEEVRAPGTSASEKSGSGRAEEVRSQDTHGSDPETANALTTVAKPTSQPLAQEAVSFALIRTPTTGDASKDAVIPPQQIPSSMPWSTADETRMLLARLAAMLGIPSPLANKQVNS